MIFARVTHIKKNNGKKGWVFTVETGSGSKFALYAHDFGSFVDGVWKSQAVPELTKGSEIKFALGDNGHPVCWSV